MKRITKKIWSHNSKLIRSREYIRDIRPSTPELIKTYKALVKEISIISFKNPDQNLFFRGQDKDYINKNGKTSIYPTIFREIRLNYSGKLRLKTQMEQLKEAEKLIMEKFQEHKILGHNTLSKFKEVRWAILQHYDVCKTPLVDITSSLRVACSFALQRNDNNFGYVFIFGFPHVNGSISYYVEEELLNLKLLSICPPDALRPHYQEGYLVGTFPTDDLEERSVRFDIANRLIAKFKIPKKRFWDENFTEIPENALYPEDDYVEDICDDIYQEID